jgi:hypothetical protein
MNLFEKFIDKVYKDDSRELKKGEVKNLLIELINKDIPDFSFNCYKQGIYYFDRNIEFRGYNLVETFHIGHSIKDKKFYCSVSSCINDNYQFSHSYNIGPLNPHIDLKVLVTGSKSIKYEDGYYFHNGKINTTEKVIIELVNDYKYYALPFLNDRYSKIIDDPFLHCGLQYISTINVNPQILKEEMEKELKRVGYIVAKINHQQYLTLRQLLIEVKGATKDYRQYIPKLTSELLELYWQKKALS